MKIVKEEDSEIWIQKDKYKGVFDQQKYRKLTKPFASYMACIDAKARINKRKYLGHYATAEEAARAYDKEAYKVFGEFAYLNFPEEIK